MRSIEGSPRQRNKGSEGGQRPGATQTWNTGQELTRDGIGRRDQNIQEGGSEGLFMTV